MASRGLAIEASSPLMNICPAVALVGAGQDLDQRRFAGAIVAEQRHHFTGEKIDGRVVDGADAAEGDRDVAHVDQRNAGGSGFLSHVGVPP
ncbi:MAG: hypothetical protein QM771_11435 [Nitrospira sp.]